jgi:hypothetical protein
VPRYFFLFLIAASSGVQAFDSPEWYSGSIVLSNQEVITGEVAIHAKQDVVLFRSQKTVTVYPAHKIQKVFFYDKKADINRRFISLVSNGYGYHQSKIYEIVLYGEVTVVRKERNFSNWDSPKDFNYFILADQKIVPIKYFKRKIFPSMIAKDQSAVASFMNDEKLNPNALADIIQIIAYYNKTEVAQNSLARK